MTPGNVPQSQQRMVTPDGRSTLIAYGLRRRALSDLYHSWLTASWAQILLVVVVLYLAINSIFACAFLISGGIENADPHSFRDAFFFSVQTIATIGYGKMSPVTLPAHLLVTLESFCGILSVALVTGLMFAKFARPTARVIWSDVAVVAMQDGRPALMLRCANARGNQVVEAEMHLGLLRDEITPEGEKVRRIRDLKLARSTSMIFALSWLVVHPIDEQSPLFGQTLESLRASNSLLFASLTGLDETFAQTIHARRSYSADEIAWGARFVDIMGATPDGRLSVDYSKFHLTRPAPF
jgi:inward rectifier potassium channel